MEVENQEKIWDKISQPWKDFKNAKPIQETVEFLENKKGKILDLGCGSGRNFVRVEGKIYGVDFSEEMLKLARNHAEKNKVNVELIKSNALEIPFENDFFDAAICVAVIHCIPYTEKREKSLEELFRVLKPGAEAWISVWDKNQEKFMDAEKETIIPWKYNGEKCGRYYYLYDKDEFLDLLRKAGFEITQANSSENPNGFNSRRNIDVIVKKPD